MLVSLIQAARWASINSFGGRSSQTPPPPLNAQKSSEEVAVANIMVDISTEKAKDEAVEMQRLKWRQAGRRRREKEKAILEGDDSEAKEKVMRSRRKRAARRRATERKMVDKSALRGTIHSTTNHPLQKSSTSSTTLRTRSSRATTTKARQSH